MFKSLKSAWDRLDIYKAAVLVLLLYAAGQASDAKTYAEMAYTNSSRATAAALSAASHAENAASSAEACERDR